MLFFFPCVAVKQTPFRAGHVGCNDNFCGSGTWQALDHRLPATAALIKGVGSRVVHAGTQSKWICIQHRVIRIDVWDGRIGAALAFTPLLLLVLRQVLLLLLVLWRHLLLARWGHVA